MLIGSSDRVVMLKDTVCMPVVHARLIMLQSCVMWGQCCMAVFDTESLSVMVFVPRGTCTTGV